MANRLSPPQAEERARYEARMTIIEHLDELRSRLFKILLALVVATVVAAVFRPQLFNFLVEPAVSRDLLNPGAGGDLIITGVTEAFFTDVKLVIYAAFVFTVPVLIYQLWAFVAPAVGDMGKVFTYILIALSSSLFLAGMVFAYFVVLPFALNFLLTFGGPRYETFIQGQAYLSFVTRFMLAFGISFELPAATYIGARLGLIDAPMLRKYRRHAIVVNAVLAAMLTPADPMSMILMAVPLIGLYEVSIVIARYVNPSSTRVAPDFGNDPDENGYRDRDDDDL
ncbi:twin-arginine translocase subunit TatC [Rubrobacter aplysinae]|uniref:twin-arginine translocase subunit TatC n=1 Tax=Rubrobacter aplysinae TaxID=909625 RepID=UPI00069DA0ED|nr:twin-arginine translocase subunit TatC [Rubrobacter aplysinae]